MVLGGVHGNEPCGGMAITRLMAELEGGTLALACGTLTCIPVVNGPAAAGNVRFVDRNLNRILGSDDAGDIEGAIAAQLRPVLAQADYLLDLHSYTAGGAPFVFAADDAATMAFARTMPAAAIITGWDACYASAFPEKPAAGMGTTEYARAHGACAVTFECGQHTDVAAHEHGYNAIRAALDHAGVLPHKNLVTQNQPPHVRMRHVFVKTGEGSFAKRWQHLEPIAKGEVFARMADGAVQAAPESGVIILPNAGVAIGTEWGYLGTL